MKNMLTLIVLVSICKEHFVGAACLPDAGGGMGLLVMDSILTNSGVKMAGLRCKTALDRVKCCDAAEWTGLISENCHPSSSVSRY